MDEIKRMGPPKAVDARGTEIRVSVPINASPSSEWVHFFQECPSQWTSISHPKLIDVEGAELMFTSAERDIAQWIQYIDKWIGDANRQYREYLERLRRTQEQAEQHERERQRRIQEVTEKLRGL